MQKKRRNFREKKPNFSQKKGEIFAKKRRNFREKKVKYSQKRRNFRKKKGENFVVFQLQKHPKILLYAQNTKNAGFGTPPFTHKYVEESTEEPT